MPRDMPRDMQSPGSIGASMLCGPGKGLMHISSGKLPFLGLVAHKFGWYVGVCRVMPEERHPEHRVVQFPPRRPRINSSNLHERSRFLFARASPARSPGCQIPLRGHVQGSVPSQPRDHVENSLHAPVPLS